MYDDVQVRAAIGKAKPSSRAYETVAERSELNTHSFDR